MDLLKKFARGSTPLVKWIVSVSLTALAMLHAFNSNASDQNRKLCVEKPIFEKPTFETRERELRPRQKNRIEKPVFEKTKAQAEKVDPPTFEKSVVEKPVFQLESIESASLKNIEAVATTNEVVLCPRAPLDKWTPIRSENRQIRFISQDHQLRDKPAPVYR
jgi:hypothetical protein